MLLSTGGKGTTSGPQFAAAFSADGTTTIAWAKPGDRYEDGGTLEVFTRTPGAPAFGAPQTLAEAASGIVAAGGPGSSAAVAWMTGADRAGRLHWRVNAALRTGSAFDASQHSRRHPQRAVAVHRHDPVGQDDRGLGAQHERRRFRPTYRQREPAG